jgi:hypothetical protein
LTFGIPIATPEIALANPPIVLGPSKDLVERLEPDAAAALGLDPERVTYSPLAELATATEKARRDAPAIAVCDL